MAEVLSAAARYGGARQAGVPGAATPEAGRAGSPEVVVRGGAEALVPGRAGLRVMQAPGAACGQ
ncbi:hypothetical protein [Nocardia iowensis]|uniref:Uncharacterized protein n=1 Tax=Nocardia iowensis TaxID=204891 RepID=A0ABX8RVE8_NOCIO|nr:hypothetical protein [Nocardia iowensis]QXN93624.1 hypothetical protein KV110_11410 [Nocardia iowensis]